MDDKIRKLAGVEPLRPAGDRVASPRVTNPDIGRTAIAGRPVAEPGRQHANAVAIKDQGAAGLDHGNDFNGHPQLRAEHRAWRESLAELLGVAGVFQIDPNVANVWFVTLGGPATLALTAPEPIPQAQIDAGRARKRAVAVQVYIRRNGHALTLSGPMWRPEAVNPAEWELANAMDSLGFVYLESLNAWVAHPTGDKFVLA